jgi:hypothetical protein
VNQQSVLTTGATFRVPRGQELRFAGRVATVVSLNANAVYVTLGGDNKRAAFMRMRLEDALRSQA